MLYFRLFGQAALQSDDGHELPAVLAQPKRLALLAYLAAARPAGFHRRDKLLGMFWPDLDQERGRAALRQSLYTLRQALGNDTLVTRGDGEIRVNPEILSCDVVQFRNRLAHDPAAAAALYTGDFLSGFFIPEAPEFERWLEEERWLLRREAASAAWTVAESMREDAVDAAARWAARAAALDPFNEAAVRRLMTLLANSGHRASALEIYQNFERLLARELDTAPSAETEKLAASLRIAPAKTNGSSAPSLEIAELPKLKRSRKLRSHAIAMAITIAVAIGVYRLVSASDAPETIAVGPIRGDGALREMLATNLARVDGLRVISNTRLLELAGGDTSGGALARAARAANAQRLLEGTLYKDATGVQRLSLQWVTLSNGRAKPAAEVHERDAFALVDAATSAIARSLSLTPPSARFASVTTHSLRAYRLYEEGLRSYYRDERTTAERLWREAVHEDSTFAMALWYLSRIHDPDHRHTARALRHAQHASDRERLFITASFLSQMDDPRTVAVAETLAIRYPAEPDGHFLLGYARMWGGDPLGAVPHFRTVVRMDTASLVDGRGLRCRACDALGEIGTAFGLADSGAVLLRFAQDWLRVQPESRGAWGQLSYAYEQAGRYAEAIAARSRANAIPPANHGDLNNAETHMRAGDFAAADAMLIERMRNSDDETRVDALFKLALSLRNQRRYNEALRATRELRRLTSDPNPIYSANPEAYVLLEMGQPRAAAALFDSIAQHPFTPLSRARNARAAIGAFARSAEAYAAAGDTIRLKQLIDTMQTLGPLTGFAPAREQHHHARGLLLRARGDHHGAAREFTAALVFPANVWTRTHYRLAQELMALGRHREAARVLGGALRSTVGGAGYGLPQRELHELAARAWTLAGRPDSARAHADFIAPARTRVYSFSTP
ncbi:MAG: BTAD domain-containing putative transcriptional regulator [Gemmatimonadota bacterium]